MSWKVWSGRRPKSAAEQLAKVFLWQHQKRDPRYAPDPPKGFLPEMMLYRKFAKAYNWTPSQVRGLRTGGTVLAARHRGRRGRGL